MTEQTDRILEILESWKEHETPWIDEFSFELLAKELAALMEPAPDNSWMKGSSDPILGFVNLISAPHDDDDEVPTFYNDLMKILKDEGYVKATPAPETVDVTCTCGKVIKLLLDGKYTQAPDGLVENPYLITPDGIDHYTRVKRLAHSAGFTEGSQKQLVADRVDKLAAMLEVSQDAEVEVAAAVETKDQEIERLKTRLAEDVKLAVKAMDEDWFTWHEKYYPKGVENRKYRRKALEA